MPIRTPTTTLVVEDEFLIAKVVAAQLLERYGCAVMTAHTLARAEPLMTEALAAGDLVFLDERLPDGRGSSLLPLARARGLAVVLMTGDPEALLRTDVPVLAKPFRACDLDRVIAAALAAEPAAD